MNSGRLPAPARRGIAVLVAATMASLLAGCAHDAGSTSTPTQSSAVPAAVSVSPPPLGGKGAGTAKSLAASIPGCNPARVGSSDTRALAFRTIPDVFTTASSAAVCTLRGHPIVIFAFADAAQRSDAESRLSGVDLYYAIGALWAAAPENYTEQVQAESTVDAVAQSLDGMVRHGS